MAEGGLVVAFNKINQQTGAFSISTDATENVLQSELIVETLEKW